MNSTGTTNPLSSLFMSLGGGLDLKDLELSSDAASGLSDFSDVLQKLASPLDSSSAMSRMQAGELGLQSGDTLPHILPLSSAASEGVLLEDTTMIDITAEDLIQQIQSPLVLSVSHSPNASSMNAKGMQGGALTLNGLALVEQVNAESLDSDRLEDQPVSAITLAMQLEQSIGTRSHQENNLAMASAVSSSLQGNGVNTSMAQRIAGRTTAEGSPLAFEGVTGDLDESELSEEFRPVTLDADKPMSDNASRGAQSALLNTLSTDIPVVTTKAPDVTFAAITSSAAQASENVESDAYEGIDLQADESLEQKLQTQLRERLEFGQDRKEWGGALGARLMTMVADGVQQARIHLDPPELGSLEIKMQVHQDQASVQVHVQNLQVKDALDASAQRLRDALNAQGIELAEFSVGTNADTEQQGGEQGRGESESGQELAADSGDDWQDSDDSNNHAKNIMSPNSLLDTFA